MNTKFKNDFSNYEIFNEKVYQMYIEEFNENFECILNKTEGEFMRLLTNNVVRLLENEYDDTIYENNDFVLMIKDLEIEIYETFYKKNKKILIKSLNNKPELLNFSFLKHCNYQNNEIIHKCSSDITCKKFIICSDNKDFIICSYCKNVYFKTCVKLFCNFCSKEFYTCFSDPKNENLNLQPATWEKYHCGIIYNCQMECIKCKIGKLFLNVKKNLLICKNCNFKSEPYDIDWVCFKCKNTFNSLAKIYNPLEYKIMKNSIKKTLIQKEYAFPKYFKCNCCINFNYMKHKDTCDGILFKGYLGEREIVLCSKCKSMTFIEKFIWKCPICKKRFRTKIIDMNDNENNNYDDDSQSFINESHVLR